MREATRRDCAIEKQEQGEGLIHIDAVVWEAMGKPETHDAWHKAMLLPQSYTIVSAGRYPSENFGRYPSASLWFAIHVLHKAIPVGVGSYVLPHVVPAYYRHFHEGESRVSLARIDIQQWSKEEGWQTVVTTDEEE